MAAVEGLMPSAAPGGRPPVLVTCRTCGEVKPAEQMAKGHGRRSTECKVCRNRRKRLLLSARKLAYPCPGCERYQACVTAWTPCEAFKAWVEAAA